VTRSVVAVLLASLPLTGCGLLNTRAEIPRAATLPPRAELAGTPFYAQADYQCGPAALAIVLVASGVTVAPDELVPQVYIPARHGSLQLEMLAAARRYERIPFVIEPSSEALAVEIANGSPVLVLLNLGVESWPIWHYAVVIGFDAARSEWILRSGTRERLSMSARRFDGAWRRASRWGVVTLVPGALPGSRDVQRYVSAVAGFETPQQRAGATIAYRAALERAPDSALLHFALGNSLLTGADLAGAETAFSRTLALDPAHVPARNNLADLLAKRGCRDAALREIRAAVAAAAGGPFETAVRGTLAEIGRLPGPATGRNGPAGCPTALDAPGP
jgi:tetratricopeptide (TPR) repeat protein